MGHGGSKTTRARRVGETSEADQGADCECDNAFKPSLTTPVAPLIDGGDWVFALALVGIILSVITQIPQVIKIAKRKQACDISLPTLYIRMTALILWTVYYILEMRVWALASVVLQGIILSVLIAFTLKYSVYGDMKERCTYVRRRAPDMDVMARTEMARARQQETLKRMYVGK